MDLNPNVVTAIAALGGSIIGGTLSLLGAKLSADTQYRQKREEVLREAANERIKVLYEPLLRIMSPGPPYDEFYLERETCSRIIDLIEKHERYASTDLLRLLWKLRHAYYEDFDDIGKGIDMSLYKLVNEEYDALKDLLGYGKILKKSKTLLLLNGIKSYMSDKVYSLKRKLFLMKRRLRRKRK